MGYSLVGSSTRPVHKKTVDGTQPPLPSTTQREQYQRFTRPSTTTNDPDNDLLIRRSSVRNRRGPPLYLQVSALRSPAHSSGPVNGVARNHEVFSPQESRAVPPRTAQARPSAESVQHPRRAPPGCRETLGERWWRARRESSGPACPRQPR